jgi:hypothetical protein
VNRIVLAILVSFACCGSALNTAAQTRKIDSVEVLKALLAMPPPLPGMDSPPGVLPVTRDPDFYNRLKPPPDDAPLEALLDYWQRWADVYQSSYRPSEAVSRRLLEACVANPELLTHFLEVLPDADSTPAKVKNIYDKAITEQKFDDAWREKVRKWLVFNSTYFINELVAMASKAKDNDKDGEVVREDAVSSLATVSWTHAEPLLRSLLATGHSRSMTLALSLFYEHAVEEKDLAGEERYRRDLQAIATNRAQPGYSRSLAVDTLSINEWSGRDDWYLALFQDETLLEASDSEFSQTPLMTLFNADEKKWVPIMSKLVESKDMNVRTAAATCLLYVDDQELAKEALVPLLPWLSNANWAKDTSNQRMRLIQLLGSIKVPESVTGLIALLDMDASELPFGRAFAAEALAQYEDPRILPALRKAFEKEKEESQRSRIIKGMLGPYGLSEREQLEALEEYAAKFATPEGRTEVTHYRTPQEEPLSPALSIGRYLGQSRDSPAESLISAVLARADELRSDKPAVADALIEIAHQWQGQQIELDIVRRIASGTADSTTIFEAIQRRPKLQEGLRTELASLASITGAAQGVGAILLDDPALAQGVLASEDVTAQIALIACARLTRTSLPTELVGPFLRHKDSLLALAAENYLMAQDSPEGRNLLWARHPNEAFITGWLETQYYGPNYYKDIIKAEQDLRAEVMKEDGPKEIVAFVSNMDQRGTVLRIYSDKSLVRDVEDPARYRERTLPTAEVSAFKDFLTTTGFAERGPIVQWCHHGCPTYEFLQLTKEKGRRVFFQGGWDEWKDLQQQFAQMATANGAKVHYKLGDEIKGLEVLYAGELSIKDVYQQSGELRVYVERPETRQESDEKLTTYNYDADDDDEEAEVARRRRRLELDLGRVSWRVFNNDQPGEVTSQPTSYSTVDYSKFITADDDEIDFEAGYDQERQTLSSDSIIIARESDGLWRQFAGSKPVRLGFENASYSSPIVTRDGKWLIVTKSDLDDEKPPHIVRLNLQTGREYRVNVPALAEIGAMAALPSGKVVIALPRLIYPPQADIPDSSTEPYKAEHYLVDPSTGAARAVTGEFRPLDQLGKRFLQPTEKPDEFWAAIPDGKKKQTQIGRYNVVDFSFKPVMAVPQLIFNGMSMWIDAGHAKVYIAYSDQLLRLPLQATQK